LAKKIPSTVFTPRAAQVNDAMYIERRQLEERLIDAVHASKYIVIHGESGNGKTWLYKRVFSANSIHFEVVNLGQFANAGSLDGLFSRKLGELGYSEKTKVETTSTAGARPMGMGVEYQSKVSDEYAASSPYLTLLKLVRDRARGSKPILVLDNFESIIRDIAALNQLAALIISADDESVTQFGVQIVIVGVPGNLKETISKLSNSAPVANRLTEIPEVARMTEDEAKALIRRGIIEELEISLDIDVNQDSLFLEICWYTDRIAQHVHELCLILANNARRNDDVIDKSVVGKSISTWTGDSLSSDMAVIEGVMNARETKVGRKNQVLYAMGQCKLEDFKYSDIEIIVKENFDTGDATLMFHKFFRDLLVRAIQLSDEHQRPMHGGSFLQS
jgi:hypothetical protein